MCSARRRTRRARTPALPENQTFLRLRFYLKGSSDFSGSAVVSTAPVGVTSDINDLPQIGKKDGNPVKPAYLRRRAFFAQLRARFARLGLCVQQKTSSFAGKTAFYSLGTLIALEKGCSAFGGGKDPLSN